MGQLFFNKAQLLYFNTCNLQELEQLMQSLLLYIIPLNALVDVLLIYNKDLGVLRGALLLFILLYCIFVFRGKHIFYNRAFLFAIYTFIVVLFSSDILTSFVNSTKVLIPILSIVIGFHFFHSKERIKVLSRGMNITFIILIINFTISNLFEIGEESRYIKNEASSFLMGQLVDHWNLFTYAILTVPLILQTQEKRKKYVTIVSAGFNAILVLLSLKRIAIVGLIFGLLINLSFTHAIRRIILIFVVSSAALYLTYPLYKDVLEVRLEARSSRFENGAWQQEGRLLESIYVWEEVLSFESLPKSFFGLDAFNSSGKYANGRFGDRQLHVDYNNIAFTIGLTGLILYLLIFVQLWRSFRRLTASVTLNDTFSKTIKSTFYTFFIVQFVTSLAGQMYSTTFRMILFVFLGSALGYFYQQSLLVNQKLNENLNC